MSSLTQAKCIPCRGGVPTLTDTEIAEIKPQVPEWELVEVEGVRRIRRAYPFRNFRQALDFAKEVGELAARAASSGHSSGLGKGRGGDVDPQDPRPPQERLHPCRQDRRDLRRDAEELILRRPAALGPARKRATEASFPAR
jgi:hypothetical protein